jgi:glucan phosphoethanolaminetransferase (alkaline phosphatase superfamily)
MFHRTEKLLQDAGRFWEVSIGWVCAFISASFIALLFWLAYLVAWRNPREYGVNDSYKVSTLVFFLGLLAIAVGFSLIAFRLIIRKRRHAGLMSPMFLRIWGVLFVTTSIVVLIDVIAKKRWMEASHYLPILSATLPMASAAFVLARRRERSVSNQEFIDQKDGKANAAPPHH